MKIKKQTKIWTCRDGRRIRICDMSTEHLINAIRFCETRARAHDAAFLLMANPFHGEEAWAAFEEAQDRVLKGEDSTDPSHIHPLYESLLLERNRRTEQLAENIK